MAQNYNTLMDALSQQEEALQSQLEESPTAFSPTVSPLSSDVQTQLKLMRVKKQREAARDKEIQARWYSEPEQRAPVEEKGIISRAFHMLGAPLYGIVGGIEAILGKGTKRGLANIPANISERETFGDLLRKYGVSNFATLPIGLALDIAFDPINWAVVGTAATIPRLIKGGMVAGAKGVGVAAQSSALSKASILSKLLPSSKKVVGATEEVGRFKSLLEKSGELKQALARKAVASKERFAELQGMTLGQEALKRGFLERGVSGVGELTRALVAKAPASIRSIVKSVTPESNWFANARNTKYGKKAPSILDDIDNVNIVDDQKSLYKKDMNRQLDEAAQMATDDVDLTRGRNFTEIAARTADEANEANSFREGARSLLELDETGIKFYDDAAKAFQNFKVKDIEIGKKILAPFQWYIKLFRDAVIGWNISTHLNAIVGDITFTGMIGINMSDLRLLKSVKKAYGVLGGKLAGKYDQVFIDDILSDSRWQSLLNNADGQVKFQGVIGLDANMFQRLGSSGSIGKFIKGEKSYAQLTKGAKEKLGRSIVAAERTEAAAIGAIKESAKTVTRGASNIPERLIAHAGARHVPGSFAPLTTGISQEVIRPGAAPTQWLMKMQQKIADGTATRSENLLYKYMTSGLAQYEKYDQSFKFGLAKHLTIDGTTAKEVSMIKKYIDIGIDDITRIPGKDLFLFSPDKALDIGLEVYMNYASLPSAIRMLRSMPFFGATFGSFVYLMTIKTLKTMGYNPAFFNKVQFALNEISGGKSPLERVALNEDYGQYYKREGMVKLPFFRDNPVYMNLANMLPFYTLNIFQEPMRGRSDYQKTLGDEVANIVDRLPIMKTPEGQVLFDYVILPYILRETNPKGAFDQQLFPKEPSLVERLGYTARGMAEPLVPPVAALLAGVPTGIATQGAPDIIKAIPSFRWRQLAHAIQGKKSIGDTGREEAVHRTVRTLSSGVGLPWYNLNLQYTKTKK